MTSSHPFQTNVNPGFWRSGADPEMEKEGVHGGAQSGDCCCAPNWLDVLLNQDGLGACSTTKKLKQCSCYL